MKARWNEKCVCASCVCVTSTFLNTQGKILWNAQFGNDLQKKKGFEVLYNVRRGHKLCKGKNTLFILLQIFMFVFRFFSIHGRKNPLGMGGRGKFSVSLTDEVVVIVT